MEATAHSIPSPVEKWLADCDERGHYTLERGTIGREVDRGKEQKKNEGGARTRWHEV